MRICTDAAMILDEPLKHMWPTSDVTGLHLDDVGCFLHHLLIIHHSCQLTHFRSLRPFCLGQPVLVGKQIHLLRGQVPHQDLKAFVGTLFDHMSGVAKCQMDWSLDYGCLAAAKFLTDNIKAFIQVVHIYSSTSQDLWIDFNVKKYCSFRGDTKNDAAIEAWVVSQLPCQETSQGDSQSHQSELWSSSEERCRLSPDWMCLLDLFQT